jgi:PII-like signaling protein
MAETMKNPVLLRIYVGENDRWKGKPLYKAIVELAKENGLAGATVLRGLVGFGKASILRTPSILRLSTDLPVVIEIVDEKEKIEEIKPKILEMVERGLVVEMDVKVLLYR